MALSLRSRRSRSDDEYDEVGDGPYDPKFPGGKVIADCGRVRARLMLTDVGLPVNGVARTQRRLSLGDGPLSAGLCPVSLPRAMGADANDPLMRGLGLKP
jgi:hypothetical protein